MKCALVTWGRRLLSAGLLLSLGTSMTLGQDVDAPLPFAEVPFTREPTEIERYLIIRGQGPEGIARQTPESSIFGGGLGLGVQGLLGGISGLQPEAVQQFVGATPATTGVSGSVLQNQGGPDLGQVLQQSPTLQTANVRRRSPVAQVPYVRGYGVGQIYSVADGVYWTAARADLDSVVNKIDPSLVDQVVVLPGPYGLRYGPGFAFIDIATVQTPRYESGYETHNRLGLTCRTNGGQIYGNDTVYGGAERYGYSVTYGQRVGADYVAGNDLQIPASYNVGNLLGQVGFDLAEDSRIEFRYHYMNEADTEYAAQFFDINSLVTNAFALSYTKGSIDTGARFDANVWYHTTEYSGDTLNSSKRRTDFPVLNRVDQAIKNTGLFKPLTAGSDVFLQAFTEGDLASLGARASLLVEPVESIQVRLGADFRTVDQALVEEYHWNPIQSPPASDFTTSLPRAKLYDPGLYAESSLEWTSFWKMDVGGRVDWAYTTARDPVETSSLGNDLDQSEPLFAAYLSNAVDINANWTTHLAAGYSEIVPELFQRYSNLVFFGMIQDGFSRVVGNPALPKERLLQADVDLEAHYDRLRGRAAFFYGWLFDYATYNANEITDPEGARLLYAINTERASMTGFELYGEYDWRPWLTPFVAARYVRGEDEVIDQPLFQIPPLEGTVGLRFEDTEAIRPWGVECGLRMVDRQDRVAFIRQRNGTGLYSVEQETPGFATAYLRGYYRPRPNLNIFGGIENLFDRTYIEHLDLRYPAAAGFVATPVLSPGITPYIGIEWTL